MVKSMRILGAAILLICSVILSVSNVEAQLCGRSYAKFVVKDSASKSISDMTIEIVAELPEKDYKELWERYGYKEPGYQPLPFKLPAQAVDEVIKRGLHPTVKTDFCGNPLKQRSNVTEVITPQEQMQGGRANPENFGFCTSEVFARHFLLKISAPHYVTDYHVGSFLGGCGKSWEFTLTEEKS
ncbi:MAG: hypothetical protein DMF68_18615 [Acidobacteria bacterium]|nr:MAG: hypothetical protein DMF68_18615 [Acidobacteriota bacterium]